MPSVCSSSWFGRQLKAAHLAIACVALIATAPVGAAELKAETARAYDEYVGAVRRSFRAHVRAGGPLLEVSAAEMTPILREGRVLVVPAQQDGIVGIPGGLVHHWKGAAFIPNVTLQQAVAASQDYANYKHIYEPIRNVAVLEQHGDTFRVVMRIQKRNGSINATLDIWSAVRYERKGNDLVYSTAASERIAEIENAGRPDERLLSGNQARGYLWRADTFSRFSEQDGGVLEELETVGLSRTFPPLLSWIIGPIARRIGRGGVEESLSEFRTAVVTARQAHAARHPPEDGASSGSSSAVDICGVAIGSKMGTLHAAVLIPRLGRSVRIVVPHLEDAGAARFENRGDFVARQSVHLDAQPPGEELQRSVFEATPAAHQRTRQPSL
jgi:hypothetical protein